jgi:nitrogen-specific signal transduction histidine kinase
MATTALSGLDLLATAVMLVDEPGLVRYMNPAAENLFGVSNSNAQGAHL